MRRSVKSRINTFQFRITLCLGLALAATTEAQTPYVNIDSPVANSVVIGSTNSVLQIWGWALDNLSTVAPYGVTNIQVGVGSSLFGGGYGLPLYQVGYGTAYRPDVCAIYPGRHDCPYVGFESDNYLGDFTLPGSYNITAYATNSNSQTGSATLAGPVWLEQPVSPANNLPTPYTGSGTTQTFTFWGTSSNDSTNFNSSAHTNDVGSIWVLFNTTTAGINGRSACFFSVDAASQTVSLVNDAGNGWQAGVSIGPAGAPTSNSQCVLQLDSAHASLNQSNGLTFTVTITFQGGFAGQNLDFWMASLQAQVNSNSGWQQVGSWTVPPGPSIMTTSLPTGTQATQYSLALAAQAEHRPIHGLLHPVPSLRDLRFLPAELWVVCPQRPRSAVRPSLSGCRIPQRKSQLDHLLWLSRPPSPKSFEGSSSPHFSCTQTE